jgi:hypothetical protein
MTFDDFAERRLIDGLLRQILRGSAARSGVDIITFDDMAGMRLNDGLFKVNSARECNQARGGSMTFDDLAGRRLSDGCLGKFCEGVQPGEGWIYDI